MHIKARLYKIWLRQAVKLDFMADLRDTDQKEL